jgi:hypothetical protein
MDVKQPLHAQHTFNRAAMATLNESVNVCDQRAGEYLDSWNLDNLQTVFLDIVLRETAIHLTKAAKRLLIMAAMNDIKLSRMTGPFKPDSHIDLNNYNSAFCSLMKEYKHDLNSNSTKPNTNLVDPYE